MAAQSTTLREKLEKIITLMFSAVRNPSVAFHFWDGQILEFASDKNPKLRIHLKDADAIMQLVLHPDDLAFTEAYFNDFFDLEGDLHEAVRVGEQLMSYKWSKAELSKLAIGAVSLGFTALLGKKGSSYKGKGSLHSISRDKEAIAYHYDTSNEFFGLWLDKNMVYSGAYFPHDTASLDEAQEYKLNYICKKLMLKPGETLLDIGCGWGALVMYAAKHYGVKATGISLSMQQVTYANNRIKELGLQDSCVVQYADYRELPEDQVYDKISSVEMLHHVGLEMLPAYFKTIKKHLKPNGISFQLSVTSVPARGIVKSPQFIDKYFQPDYHLAPISTLTAEAEKAGFELYDVENVREHYYRTAKLWLERLEYSHEAVCKEVNEFTYRVLRLGLFMMMIGFLRGEAGFYHFVLMNKKTFITDMPLNRKTWLL